MPTPNKKPETKKRKPRAQAPSRAKSRIGKKAVVGYFSPEVSQKLSIIAATEGSSIQSLLGEAIDLLLKKRGEAPPGER